MKKLTQFFTVATVLLILFSWSHVSIAQAQDRPLVPDFTLDSFSGDRISLSDHAGKVVVLNFWASWCPHCREEMAEFQRLHNDLVDSGDAVLLMLNQVDGVRETRQSANKFLADHKYDFITLYDHGMVGYSIFGIPGLPTTVVIDKEGYFSSFVVGPTDYKTVMQMIKEAK